MKRPVNQRHVRRHGPHECPPRRKARVVEDGIDKVVVEVVADATAKPGRAIRTLSTTMTPAVTLGR
jgi:hypothetical protein